MSRRRLSLAAVTAAVLLGAPPLAAQSGPKGPNLIDQNAWTGNGWGQVNDICPGAGGRVALCLIPPVNWETIVDENDIPVLHVWSAGPAVVSQTIATTPGQAYFLSFLANQIEFRVGSASLDVLWNDTPVLPVPGRSGPSEYRLSATGSSTTLEFRSEMLGECVGGICDDWGAVTFVTDVTLQEFVTPEPATLALVGGGLLALGVGVRRRRS
jgi:hypothetical protein